MIDIKLIRAEPARIQAICAHRGANVDIGTLLAVDAQRTRLQLEADSLRNQSNRLAEEIGRASSGERPSLIQRGTSVKKELRVVEDLLSLIAEQHLELLASVPNIYAPDTPEADDASGNLEIAVHGSPPRFDFAPRDHISLVGKLGMDFEAGARIAGSGFPLLRGNMALLESAVLRFVLDRAVAHGFTPVSVPLLARREILEGAGFNPRRGDEGTEIFSTLQDDLCLCGTAEIPLAGQYAGQVLNAAELPLKLVAMSACFRREGAHGRRDAGLYRNKMFHKVEVVMLAAPTESDKLLDEILAFEIGVFQALGLYFRIIRICSADLGAPAYQKYDLEGWMLGRGEDQGWGWGELTSCSNCTDYQARRLDIRHRAGREKATFVHTLNGTGITTRALIPILEQCQRTDGAVVVPAVLRPYLGGREVLA